ncbi:hypothetical protein ABTM92_19975, partial [Acinetobacter baumannii]
MIETWGTGSGHDFGFLAACALLAGLIVRRGWVWAGQFLWLALTIAAASRLVLWDCLFGLEPGHALRLAVGTMALLAAL